MNQINFYSLQEAHKAAGLVVVVDVLRAFTTAAHAFNVGATKILPVSGVEEAIQLRKKLPGSLIMGEVNGVKPERFDIGNSPAIISALDLQGITMIQRTSAGTQGIVSAVNADHLFAASFVVARETAKSILSIDPTEISFIITGESMDRDGDEDRACAEYIQALISGVVPEPGLYTSRVLRSSVARSYLSGRNRTISEEDLKMSIQADTFDFSLPVRREGSLWVMNSQLSKV